MDFQAVTNEIVTLFRKDPQAAIAKARTVLAILASMPGVITAAVPNNATLPVLMYARDNPTAAIEFAQALLSVLGSHSEATLAISKSL